MSSYQVQYIDVTLSGPYICYPKASSNDRTWDGRQVEGFSWEITQGKDVKVNLIGDASFNEGDMITVGIDTVAGSDASSPTILIVTKNGHTASFDASGTSFNTHLTYTGTKNN